MALDRVMRHGHSFCLEDSDSGQDSMDGIWASGLLLMWWAAIWIWPEFMAAAAAAACITESWNTGSSTLWQNQHISHGDDGLH